MENQTDNLNTPDEGQVDQAGKDAVSSPVVDTNIQVNKPAPTTNNAPASGQDVNDTSKRYESLEKSYKELQRFSTQTAQERAELRKELQALKSMVEEATKKPFNIEEFKREWETKGPKALDPYLEPRLKELESNYQKQIQESNQARVALETQVEIYSRRGDSENYPDFEKLEPTMTEIANDPNCPINLRAPVNQVLDALYKLAQERNSGAALKQAETMGRKKAEHDLAKESRTTVAGGGKKGASTTTDLSKLPFNKLEEVVQNMVGIADRDI